MDSSLCLCQDIFFGLVWDDPQEMLEEGGRGVHVWEHVKLKDSEFQKRLLQEKKINKHAMKQVKKKKRMYSNIGYSSYI